VSTTRTAARFLLATHGLGPELEAELEAIIDSCFPHLPEPGDLICREGEPSRDLYFLLEGRVQVRMRDYLGIEQDLAVLTAPTMFGHMGMIDRSPRSATCEAITDARVHVLDRARFEQIIDDPGPPGDMFRRLLLSAMSRQLSTGNLALQRLLSEHDDTGGTADPGDTSRRLSRISGTLEGWEQHD
jgi:CRP-like cAMP-binding protein